MGVTGQTQRFSRIHSATFLVIAVPSSSDCCAQTVEQCPSALCSSAILVAEQPSPVTTMRHCCPRAGSPGRAAARRPALGQALFPRSCRRGSCGNAAPKHAVAAAVAFPQRAGCGSCACCCYFLALARRRRRVFWIALDPFSVRDTVSDTEQWACLQAKDDRRSQSTMFLALRVYIRVLNFTSLVSSSF